MEMFLKEGYLDKGAKFRSLSNHLLFIVSG